MEQLAAEIRAARGVDAELEDEQRRGDGEDAVAERLRSVSCRTRHSRDRRRELAADQPHGLEVRVQEVLEHHAVAARALVLPQPRGDLVDRADDARSA